MTLLSRLEHLRPLLAEAADGAVQDHEWDDEGGGGACDAVAAAMHGVLAEHGIDATEGGQEGDDHAWLVAYDVDTGEAAGVDVPAGTYEVGGGYSWRRRAGATVTADDVELWRIPFRDVRSLVEEAEEW